MRYQIKLYKESNRILYNIVQGIPFIGNPCFDFTCLPLLYFPLSDMEC